MSKAAPAPSVVHVEPLFLARDEAAAFLSISTSTLEEMVARGDLPKPRKVGARRAAWLVAELRAWGLSRPVSDLLPPPNSGYGRGGAPAAGSASK